MHNQMYTDLPSFSAAVISAKVGAEEQVFSIPGALLSKLGKGWEKSGSSCPFAVPL